MIERVLIGTGPMVALFSEDDEHYEPGDRDQASIGQIEIDPVRLGRDLPGQAGGIY